MVFKQLNQAQFAENGLRMVQFLMVQTNKARFRFENKFENDVIFYGSQTFLDRMTEST